MTQKRLHPRLAYSSIRRDQLRALIPEVFFENQLNWDILREVLEEPLLEESEHSVEQFGLSWPGKKEARRIAGRPSQGTLKPVANEGVNGKTTRNIFIEGDNLEVLKLLQKSYSGQVKLIYIDPPYNTGNEYIYKDRFAEPLNAYLKITKQLDDENNPLTSNPKESGRFHSTWLSMMYSRLLLARALLKDDGILFVSIDDNEVHHLRMILNEIFGEENFLANVIWQKKYTRSNDARWFSDNHDHILVYARSADSCVLNLEPRSENQLAAYSNPDNHPKGPWKATPLHAKSGSGGGFKYKFRNGVIWAPPPGTYPRFSDETFARMDANDEIWFGADGKATPARKSFLADVKSGVTPVTIWLYDEVGHTHEANNELKQLGLVGVFDNPKPTRLIKKILQLATSSTNSDLVLDFFSGSSSTAQAVLELNLEDGGDRQFILTQIPEPTGNSDYPTISEIGKERIRRVIKKLKTGQNNKPKLEKQKVDLGFRVLKLAPSNYRAWQDYDGEDVKKLETFFDLAASPLLDGWKPEEVHTEIILLEGFPLDSNVTAQPEFNKNEVQLVESDTCAHRLFICLDKKIKDDTIKNLKMKTADVFVCLDSALTDEDKVRLSDTGNLRVI